MGDAGVIRHTPCGPVVCLDVRHDSEAGATAEVASFVAAAPAAQFGPVVERCGGVFGAYGECTRDEFALAAFVLGI